MARKKKSEKGSVDEYVSRPISSLIHLAVWLTGIFVSLAVGFGMIDGTLQIWWIPFIVTRIAGWIVVILTIVSVIMAIVDRI